MERSKVHSIQNHKKDTVCTKIQRRTQANRMQFIRNLGETRFEKQQTKSLLVLGKRKYTTRERTNIRGQESRQWQNETSSPSTTARVYYHLPFSKQYIFPRPSYICVSCFSCDKQLRPKHCILRQISVLLLRILRKTLPSTPRRTWKTCNLAAYFVHMVQVV